MTSPMIIVPTADQVLAVARHPHDLADGFRAMQNTLGLSNQWLDQAGGFGEEQVGKYLGPSHVKQIGPFYFQMLCSLLAVEWRMHVDVAQAQRMMAQWEARKPQYVQPNSRAPSKEILERARKHVLAANGRAGGLKSASLPGAQLVRSKGGKARMKSMSKRERRELASKAANARWAKQRNKTALVVIE